MGEITFVYQNNKRNESATYWRANNRYKYISKIDGKGYIYLENQAFSTVNLRQWFRLHAISLLYWCLNLEVFVDVWLSLKKFMGKFSMVYKQWVLWYGVGPIKTISACNYFNPSRFVWSIPDTLLFHTHLVTCKSAKEWYLMRMYISCLCPFKNHLIIFLKNLTIPIYISPKFQGH